jgi:hypothetical protein
LFASASADIAPDAAAVAAHLSAIESARSAFDASLATWSSGIDDPAVTSFIQESRTSGGQFFDLYETGLKTAAQANEAAGVVKAIASMAAPYDAQQAAVGKLVAWTNVQVLTHEANTDDLVRNVAIFGGSGIALLTLLSVLLSVRVRRSIVRPIRALAGQAKRVATRDLADAVQLVHELPSDAPVPHLPEFRVETSDELADLAASFTSVQDTAVDLAAAQALARRTVSENLVNIARRSQTLLGRTLGFISTLEQGERDPEALDNLFRLDHLATRMRRNAQSLLVLAGAEPTRLWSPPVAMGDVVRAALSEVENYGQVELADLGDVYLQGAVATEVAHLLAELLENATSFSPPSSPVTVVGRSVPDGHQLAIFDYGIGMTHEELAEANHRLNQVSSFDRDNNKMLGFQVVSRLAARHGVSVMLTTTPGGTGVTAIVRLPRALMEARSARPDESRIADLPAAGEQLTAPLPVPEMALVTAATFEPLLDGERAATLDQPAPNAGLPKRVRGAQLPDLGSAEADPATVRPADEVRDTLSSLQRGLDLGRQHGTDQ